MKTTLKENVGEPVTVDSYGNDMPETVRPEFSLNGTLEAPDEDDGSYFVRVKECYNGTSGVRFCERHCLEVERMLSGRTVITLKRQ